MRALLAIIAVVLMPSCIATSGDLEQLGVELTRELSHVADSAAQSSEAARDAFRQGEITYTELQQRLADIRGATLEAAEHTTGQVIGELKEVIESRPEVAAQVAGDASRTLIPGPAGEILAALLLAGGTYAASSRRSRQEAQRMSMERDMARMARGEPVSQEKAGG